MADALRRESLFAGGTGELFASARRARGGRSVAVGPAGATSRSWRALDPREQRPFSRAGRRLGAAGLLLLPLPHRAPGRLATHVEAVCRAVRSVSWSTTGRVPAERRHPGAAGRALREPGRFRTGSTRSADGRDPAKARRAPPTSGLPTAGVTRRVQRSGCRLLVRGLQLRPADGHAVLRRPREDRTPVDSFFLRTSRSATGAPAARSASSRGARLATATPARAPLTDLLRPSRGARRAHPRTRPPVAARARRVSPCAPCGPARRTRRREPSRAAGSGP